MMRAIHNEYLDHRFELVESPRRVVCLVSSATEAMERMGLLERICGVSEYCERYVDTTNIPVVGQYLLADIDAIKALKPDLILLTTGIQKKLSEKLAKEGLPIYNLNLPSSFEGMLECIVNLGGLLNEMTKAQQLVVTMREQAAQLRLQNIFKTPPKVYVELWLGRHRRAVAGLSYIRDLVEMAGGRLVYSDRPVGYFENDLDSMSAEKPDAYVFFHEPEYLIDGAQLIKERGWDSLVPFIMSTVKSGENMIQDGPSMLTTTAWLHQQLKEALS